MTSALHRELKMPDCAVFAREGTIASTEKICTDLSSGAGITCLGYSADEIKQAMVRQINQFPYVHSGAWTSEAVEQLSDELLRITDFRGGAVLFLNSGAEAVEAACKIGAQFFRERGERKLPEFHAREKSYHGNTLFTLALGDHSRKKEFQQLLPEFQVMRFPAFAPSWGIGRNSLEELAKNLRLRRIMGNPAVVVIETIGGTTIGIEPSRVSYLTDIRELCNQYDALLVYDEVLCGNYRTGFLFAYQYYQAATNAEKNFSPDIVCLGKGLTGGYFPMSAVIVSKRIVDIMRFGSHKLWHSTTNMHHPIGAAAGLAALGLYQGDYHQGAFATTLAMQNMDAVIRSNPLVDQVTGTGALFAIRLLPEIKNLHEVVKNAAKAAGIALYTEGGTMNGYGNFLLIAPPYCMDRHRIEQELGKLLQVLEDVNRKHVGLGTRNV